MNGCFIIDYELKLLLFHIIYGWVTQMALFVTTTSFPSVKAVFLRLLHYTYHPSSLCSYAPMRVSMHPLFPLPFGGLLFVSFRHIPPYPRTAVVLVASACVLDRSIICWMLPFVLDVFIIIIVHILMFYALFWDLFLVLVVFLLKIALQIFVCRFCEGRFLRTSVSFIYI